MNKLLINDPESLRELPDDKLKDVADSLRQEILDSVCTNGGHLASSLGAVELIVALHKVFKTPEEQIFFDVGHQSYAHKLLTGRRDSFKNLRKYSGCSGFPSPFESEFDPAVAGHAGVALSEALGVAAANPDSEKKVIAVVGDGAAGCGVTLEALNHVSSTAGASRLIVILNDNRMSISGNVGRLSQMLNRVIAAPSYNVFRRGFKKFVGAMPRIKNLFSRLNEAGKGIFLPPSLLFETFGFRYFGAIDGNDLNQLLPTLRRIKEINGPLLLHVITKKGYGCDFAQQNPVRYHGISGCDKKTGKLPESGTSFTGAFSDSLCIAAEKNPQITAITPAMLSGSGLTRFAEKFPQRCFDTGIAEEHAISFAAGLAIGGKIPICTFYDTFLQRALDGVYHDIALAKLPVVIVVDRAGIVADGPTHHGIYNCGFLRAIPNLTILLPAAPSEVAEALEYAINLHAPVVIRYPRGGKNFDIVSEPFRTGKAVIQKHGSPNAPVIWACGAEVDTALKVAGILDEQNIDCTVINARFLKPFDKCLATKFAENSHFTIEDHCVSGGLSSALNEALSEIPHGTITAFGWSSEIVLPHGEPELIRDRNNMTAEKIAEKIALKSKFL